MHTSGMANFIHRFHTLARCRFLPRNLVFSDNVIPFLSHKSRVPINNCRTLTTQQTPSAHDSTKATSNKGPVRWAGLVATLIVGGTAVYYVKQAKDEMELKREKAKKKSIGKAAIGGPFTLVNHLGKTVSSQDFLGQWLMLYFGFTHCPDVCPDTLEKLQNALDIIDKTKDSPGQVLPLFITVDPKRDDVETVAEYIKDFHPRTVGLTGTEDQVKETCKTYRVYYSAGPADADNDYIVDHSVILYLVDPKGQFVDYFGQNMDEHEIANTTISHMLKYKLTNASK